MTKQFEYSLVSALAVETFNAVDVHSRLCHWYTSRDYCAVSCSAYGKCNAQTACDSAVCNALEFGNRRRSRALCSSSVTKVKYIERKQREIVNDALERHLYYCLCDCRTSSRSRTKVR